MGGVYTSPYNLVLNGVPTPLICDDFNTDVQTTGTWQATATSLSSLMGETTASTVIKFDQSSPTQQVLDYSTAAVLAAELMSLPNTNTPEGAHYSFAIWGIFDPTLLQNPSSDTYGTLNPADAAAASVLLQQAANWVKSASNGSTVDFSKVNAASGLAIQGLTIYTPSPNKGQSQEFLGVSMPEPSYPAVLGLDLLAAVGLIAIFGRRKALRAR